MNFYPSVAQILGFKPHSLRAILTIGSTDTSFYQDNYVASQSFSGLLSIRGRPPAFHGSTGYFLRPQGGKKNSSAWFGVDSVPLA